MQASTGRANISDVARWHDAPGRFFLDATSRHLSSPAYLQTTMRPLLGCMLRAEKHLDFSPSGDFIPGIDLAQVTPVLRSPEPLSDDKH